MLCTIHKLELLTVKSKRRKGVLVYHSIQSIRITLEFIKHREIVLWNHVQEMSIILIRTKQLLHNKIYKLISQGATQDVNKLAWFEHQRKKRNCVCMFGTQTNEESQLVLCLEGLKSCALMFGLLVGTCSSNCSCPDKAVLVFYQQPC